MKIISIFIILVAVLGTSGCATSNIVDLAQGHPEEAEWFTFRADKNAEPKSPPVVTPHPAYILLVPLTVPVDIVTLPIQAVDYCYVLLNGCGYQ
jgi:hypothetical protein